MMDDEFSNPSIKFPGDKPYWRVPAIRTLMAYGAMALMFAYLALPSVSHCGEPMRYHACLNNLRQIGLGLAAYESSQGSYPIGSIPNPDLPVDRRLGWMVSVVPFLDVFSKENVPDDLARPWDDTSYTPLRSQGIGFSHCPSRDFVAPGAPRPTSYVGIGGLGVDAPGLSPGHPRAGFFNDHRAMRVSDVSDGLSNTMAVAESLAPSGPWFAGGRHAVRGLDPSRPPYIGVTSQFGSNHGEWANVLMADGSVRTVKARTDPKVFEALSTIAGGEKVSVPGDD